MNKTTKSTTHLAHIIPPERLNEENPVRSATPAYVTTAMMRRLAFVEGRIDPENFKTCYREGAVNVLGEYDGSEPVCDACGGEFLDWSQIEANIAWAKGEIFPPPTP